MATCVVNGKELPKVTHYLAGYECREKGKELCPNYMHHMVHGRNCRLLQDNRRKYSRLCLRSTLEPIKQLYNNKSTVELAGMYKRFEEKYFDDEYIGDKVILRAQLGAIEEIIEERRKGVR